MDICQQSPSPLGPRYIILTWSRWPFEHVQMMGNEGLAIMNSIHVNLLLILRT